MEIATVLHLNPCFLSLADTLSARAIKVICTSSSFSRSRGVVVPFPMPRLWISTYSQRLTGKFWMIQHLDTGIKTIRITVDHYSVHLFHFLFRTNVLFCYSYYISFLNPCKAADMSYLRIITLLILIFYFVGVIVYTGN